MPAAINWTPEPCDDVLADFARRRVDHAFRELQKVIAEDYAQDMSKLTGFHPDFYRQPER